MAINIKQTDASVNGSTLILTETEESLATTPLAEVPSGSSPESVIVVEGGAVRQVAVDEVVSSGLSALGKLNATALFTGQVDGGGSALVLSEAKNHFEFVLYVFRTNNEQTSVLLPSVQGKPCIDVAIGPWESSTNCMKYNAYFEIVFSDQVNAVCNDSYNNANLRLHLINVYGINRVSS